MQEQRDAVIGARAVRYAAATHLSITPAFALAALGESVSC